MKAPGKGRFVALAALTFVALGEAPFTARAGDPIAYRWVGTPSSRIVRVKWVSPDDNGYDLCRRADRDRTEVKSVNPLESGAEHG